MESVGKYLSKHPKIVKESKKLFGKGEINFTFNQNYDITIHY